jgi:hypothetical protein
MIDEEQMATLMRAAAEDIDVRSAPADLLVGAGRRSLRRRRAGGAAAVLAAVAAVAVTGALVVGAEEPARTPSGTTGDSVAGCLSPVPAHVLPVWARGGFSDPRPKTSYVLGDRDSIAAILFGQPLTAPPGADHNNKILWVSRLSQDPVTDLRIHAQLLGGSTAVERVVAGGPGPSIIDLPSPGCWRLTLRWSGHTDSLDLVYSGHQAP